MNNKPKTKRLAGSTSQSDSLKRNLLTDLVVYEHLKTTESRAKAIIPMFDKVINIAKKDDKRIAETKLNKILFSPVATKKVMEVFVSRLADSEGGYLNHYKIGRRKGDNAPMVKMFVKGYVYKEVGNKTKSKKGKETKKVQKEAKHYEVEEVKDAGKVQSQIDTKASQGKAKSRSGI